MRIYLIKEFWDESWREVLPVNNWYEGELTPVYNPQTMTMTKLYYIVKCSDGKFRKAGAEHFLTLEEWRQRQLDKIL